MLRGHDGVVVAPMTVTDPGYFDETVHVDTGALGLRDVVEHVAASCGLTLTPDTDGPARAALRRAAVGVRHVRLF